MVMEEEKNKNSKLGGPKLGYCVILCFTVLRKLNQTFPRIY